ncbi:hypothetical protein M0802_008233 [Mischocyttarus mexicanus]|nr:hypothetical protein M0802_008233 [Mischocyttarus mexicanus]
MKSFIQIPGILLINAVTDGMKATRPKFKIATTSTTTTTEESLIEENENADAVTTSATNSSEGNATTGHTLTGIPQIDYIWDPNLPRELNGYNLSDYPFYNSIPEDIDFKCDGLHDGFYASVPHKCQVYHHCLYGTRYDFLCANFTAFDQKTFICHFVSEVDCANSKKYWHRNDALYKATTSSTTSTSTTTTTTTVPPVTVGSSSNGRASSRERDLRRRRPYSRRRPYDYYDEDYYDDEYTRSRGYDRRDDYEYEDNRKYRRDRDRDVRDRDRDFRDRDNTRSRETPIREERDREVPPRERYPTRNNRRDQTRQRDPPEEDIRGLKNREQEQSRSREIEDPELDDRRIIDPRGRDNDDRRYSDKRFRDDYDDKDSGALPSQGSSVGVTEGLVKPAAPITSVYSRPRAPPKIRRPVPLSEQDRYAYKSTSTEEPRRRPVDLEDDYYDDELEDIRPMRRPIRRRPSYRERDRDRDIYDVRDRERDRPFRIRYREDEDDIRPRKHPDRSRDRYYERERERERDRSLERGRDRSIVDRGKDLSAPRSLDRDRGRYQDADRIDRPYSSSSNRPLEREKDNRQTIDEKSRSSFRSKDLSDITETSRRPISTTSTTCMPEMPLVHETKPETKQIMPLDRFERPERPTRPSQSHSNNNNNGARVSFEEKEENLGEKSIKQPPPHYTTYQERDQDEEDEQDHRNPQLQQQQQHHTSSYSEEYSSEYYDEPEDPPIPPPRTTVRIVKRPFLPSRGGVPNPRGLSPVGTKASRREEDRSTERTNLQQHEENHKSYYVPDQESKRIISQDNKREEEKQAYDAYKVIQSDLQQKQRQEDYDVTIARPILRRPVERQREEEETKPLELNPISKTPSTESYEEIQKTLDLGVPTINNKWSTEEFVSNKESNDGIIPTSSGSPVRSKSRQPVTETSSLYSSTYKDEDIHEQPSGPSSYRVKQRINEVTHKLQDIPDSEYDVTLNDALTPTLNQETNLPSGFVLPLHRQLSRDTVLQPSEDNYKITRPIGQQQQQKPFVPSPQYDPAPGVQNDRQRTVYYRTPESIPYSGQHYRQQSGPWQDYTGY